MCNCGRRVVYSAPPAPAPPQAPVPVPFVLATPLTIATPPPTYTPMPTVWGPPLWKAMHTAAEFGLPINDKWLSFFIALRPVIPCPDCQQHFATWWRRNQFITDPRMWLFNLHNDVNRRTGLPLFAVSDLASTYGVTSGKTATDRLNDINVAIGQLKTSFENTGPFIDVLNTYFQLIIDAIAIAIAP